VCESGYAGFRRRRIPLVHQVAVAGPFRRRCARHRSRPGNWSATPDIATLTSTVGLFDEDGPGPAAVRMTI
jgi:hypothetical protein